MPDHLAKGQPPASTYVREKVGVPCDTNRETPCRTINMQSSHYSFQFAALCLVASTAAAGIYGHGYGHGYAHGYAYPLADSVPAAVNGLQVSERLELKMQRFL